MSLEVQLQERSLNACELCKRDEDLSVYELGPFDDSASRAVYLCQKCQDEIAKDDLDESYFMFLNDTMWSEHGAVVALSYRLLKRLGRADLLDMIYLDDETKAWVDDVREDLVVKDSNGVDLRAGDSVTIIKDLEVKGAGFTAKRGTMVKNITIPQDVEGHIEGRVNGVKIYLKAEFLKKA
jgi:protein PhnA